MNWPEQESEAAAAPQATEGAPPDAALFINDSGELPLDTRRALVQLLSGPSLDGRRHARLWPILLRDEAAIRRRLNELFLDLVIDRDLQVAFTSQVDAGELEVATTCLAAALRYQLGGSDTGIPLYAPVVLDEAFDKADNEFTALAMNIFANFGFQMIVATPLKSVMTLEPFIGGACFVDIRDRRVSGVLMIEYDEERQRLRLPEHAHAEAGIEAAE
jgi:uncharacterized protein YPO0396